MNNSENSLFRHSKPFGFEERGEKRMRRKIDVEERRETNTTLKPGREGGEGGREGRDENG